ncbi:ATP-dependent nuclease [Nonomuraea sp. ZG12]|uniref:ATP-dependent nuclease n=1 Tax=Nonomuraea sp. ZG12 TaxID=3452207 RepID=UPI003F898D86
MTPSDQSHLAIAPVNGANQRVYLHSFSVRGFRSLLNVRDIPVSKPTILAGHNDGGKTAILAAVAYLAGGYALSDDDRTYIAESAVPGLASARCEMTEVEGLFTLDAWEQQSFRLPAEVRLRRSAGADLSSRLECWLPVPLDERLRDLSPYKVPDLKALVKEFGLSPASQLKADLESVVREYAEQNAGPEGWTQAPPALQHRMPKVLPFGGKSAEPDEAVKSVLHGCLQTHMEDESLHGQLRTIEADLKERLRADAESLCDHIRDRCPDLSEVFVDPDISFSQGLRAAPLRIARATGEHVGLERSGLGSRRRISLAIWEWTSEFLTAEHDVGADALDEGGAGPTPTPLQTIIVYDEPDTHLDYAHQRKIMQLIREQSSVPSVNVIVATHSMNLIDGVDISDVVNLKLEDGRTVMERLGVDDHDSIDRHLQGLASSLGLRNSVLLHERCFLAVEGPSEQRAIPLLFRLAEGMSLQSAGIALWACNNNEGALNLARYLVQHGRSVVLMVDADSKNLPKSIFKPERLRHTFGRDYDTVVQFLGEPDSADEFEEVFSDELWAEVANAIWGKDLPWLAEDFRALRDQGKFSTEVLQMLQSQSKDGPNGKPDMMFQLASTLTEPTQVPAQLRRIFALLRQRAA